MRAITVEEALNKAGGFGRFQCLYLVLLVMAMNSAGLVVYGISYYEKAPPYICQYNSPQDPAPGDFIAQTDPADPNIWQYKCSQKQVCAVDQSTDMVAMKYDTDDKEYIDNWIIQCNLNCLPSLYLGILGGIAFLGAALACFFLPQLADSFGRYPIFMVTMFF